MSLLQYNGKKVFSPQVKKQLSDTELYNVTKYYLYK